MSKTAVKLTTPGDLEAVITRVVDAPRGMVFDAHTKPELVKRWLSGLPGWTLPVCEIDLRVGGKYRYEWRGPQGESMGMGGTFTEIVRPSRIVATQLFDQDWTGGETIVSTEIVEQNGKSTITTTVRYSSRAARDAAIQTGMTSGMEMSYERLDALLKETANG